MYSYHQTTKGWVVNKLVNGNIHCLGIFDTAQDARIYVNKHMWLDNRPQPKRIQIKVTDGNK